MFCVSLGRAGDGGGHRAQSRLQWRGRAWVDEHVGSQHRTCYAMRLRHALTQALG